MTDPTDERTDDTTESNSDEARPAGATSVDVSRRRCVRAVGCAIAGTTAFTTAASAARAVGSDTQVDGSDAGSDDSNDEADGLGEDEAGEATPMLTPVCRNAAGGETLSNGDTVCDQTGDGNYRDVTDSGDTSVQDLHHFFVHQHREPYDSRPDLFDYTGNGEVGQPDVVDLFHYI